MQKYFKYKKHIMDNGLQIYHISTKAELFSLNIGIKIGSKYETVEEKGLSHFLEHMIFKGTRNRDNIKINEDIEDLAGYSNAYTSYSDTEYKIMALNEEFDNAVEILSDLIIFSTFPEEEFKKEKEVIISEIKSDLDNLEDFSFFNISKNSFESSFLKWDIAGEIDGILNYNIRDIIQYYKKYYIPNNSIIVVASSFEDKYIFDIVEKYFGKWISKEKVLPEVLIEKNKEQVKVLERPDFEQSSIIYLYTFHGLTNREEIALGIVSYCLGENSNSHLFKRLREEKGMTYEVYTDLDTSEDIKTLYIYTSLANENVKKAKEIIDFTIEEMKSGKLIEEKSVKLMKKILRTSIASTLLDPQHISDYVMSQALEGRSMYEFIDNLKTIENISVDEIVEVAKKVLNNPSVQVVLGSELNEE